MVDGHKIEEGDSVLAVSSNGLHTNGYSLVRLLMDKKPEIKLEKIEGKTFIEQIMKPHTSYHNAIKNLVGKEFVHGMAHITGGGIEGNLSRIIPDGLSAEIDLSLIDTLPVFSYIKKAGEIGDEEMPSTFNCGVGFNIVVKKKYEKEVIQDVSRHFNCYRIGEIKKDIKKLLLKMI